MKKKSHCLKWSSSRDYTIVFFEIVKDIKDIKLEWNAKFPMKFTISGSASYMRPLRLEMSDPNIIKMIDCLKGYIKNDDKYIDELKIPKYIRNTKVEKLLQHEYNKNPYFLSMLYA